MWWLLAGCAGLSGLSDDSSSADTSGGGLPCDTVFWPDADGDGYGVPGEGRVGCVPPTGYAATDDDCDDADPDVHPDAETLRDGEDSDCDGRRDWLVRFWITVDDAFVWCLDRDDVELGAGSNWTVGYTYEQWLPSGEHVIGIQGWDTGRVITAGVAHFEISTGALWTTDETWRYDPNPQLDPTTRRGWCSPGFDDTPWHPVKVIGPVQSTAPWNNTPPQPWPAGSPAQWVWDDYPVDLNTQYLRKAFTLP